MRRIELDPAESEHFASLGAQAEQLDAQIEALRTRKALVLGACEQMRLKALMRAGEREPDGWQIILHPGGENGLTRIVFEREEEKETPPPSDPPRDEDPTLEMIRDEALIASVEERKAAEKAQRRAAEA